MTIQWWCSARAFTANWEMLCRQYLSLAYMGHIADVLIRSSLHPIKWRKQADIWEFPSCMPLNIHSVSNLAQFAHPVWLRTPDTAYEGGVPHVGSRTTVKPYQGTHNQRWSPPWGSNPRPPD